MCAWEFASLQHVADKNGWHKFIAMQDFYNLLHREEEREMIPFCKANDIGLIPWSPIAKGVLARPHSDRTTGKRADSDRHIKVLFVNSPNPEADKEITDRVEKVAKKRGVSMSVVATSWVRGKGCIPIVGCSTVERIEEAVQGLQFRLTEDEQKYLEEPYRAKPVSGY